MTLKRELAGLVLSDLHIGHSKLPVDEAIEALDAYFDHYRSPKHKLDIIFLAGDVFDHGLWFSANEVHSAIGWITRLVDYCAAYRIKLRILEGTGYHDQRQSLIFETIASRRPVIPDVRYFAELAIEMIPDWGLSVLYVPDELHSDPEVTLTEVQALLATHNLPAVDLAIMHGMFRYQCFDPTEKSPRHREDAYLALVHYYIFIGHVHTFSVWERIIAQGSFGRYRHGEEEAKGGVWFCLKPKGESSYWFVENTRAKKFITLSGFPDDLTDAMQVLTEAVRGLETDTYVRLKLPKHHPLHSAFAVIRRTFPLLTITKDTVEPVAGSANPTLADQPKVYEFDAIALTPANFKEVLLTALRDKHTLTTDHWRWAEQYLPDPP